MPDPDAIVIGSGPNGLVAANLLTDAGWDVLVLEAQPRVGGAVASDSSVLEGYVHDTFSSFYPLAAASPTIAGLNLERHGLEWVHAPAVVGHALDEGRWAILHRDRNATAASLDDLCPGDGDAWLELCQWWSGISEPLIGALLTPFPPVRHGSSLGLRAVRPGGLDLVRRLLMPARSLGAELFRGEGPRLLLAGNAAHADIPVDSPGSGVMGLLLVMLGQELGFPVPRGGAGKLAEAMAARLEVAGGTVRTSCRVAESSWRTAGPSGCVPLTVSDRQSALRRRRRAAPHLYGGLVDWGTCPTDCGGGWRASSGTPERSRSTGRSTAPSRGAVRPSRRLRGPCTSPRPSTRSPCAGAEIAAGIVPREGLVLLGQMATTDPTRAPRSRVGLGLHPRAAQGRQLSDKVTAQRSSPGPGRATPRNGWRTGCRRASSSGRRVSAIASWRAGCSGRPDLEASTRTSWAVPSTVAPPRCSSSSSCAPCRGWDGRRPRSRASTSDPPRHIRVAACTGPAAPTPPAQRWRTHES